MSSRHPVPLIPALFLLLNAWPAFADYRAEDDFYGEAPIVLTVSRLDKPLAESPASVSVIDRQMIRDSGATSLSDILRLAPGFIVGYYKDNSPVITYQGLGARWMRRLQVLIDGRSVFIPSYGGVPWNNLPLLIDDIERIEITRGPNAVTYGANAFLATINIITRHSAEDLGHALSGASSIDEDSGIRSFYYRYGGNREDLDWRLSLGHEEDDGYSDLSDSKQANKINLRLDYLSAHNHFWALQLGFSDASVHLGDGDVTDPFRHEVTDNGYFNGSWEAIDDQVTSRVRLTLTRQQVDDHFRSGPLNQYLAEDTGNLQFLLLPPFDTWVDLDRDSIRSELELYQNRRLSPRLQINYGGNLRQDRVRSYFLFNDQKNHQQTTRRLFGSLEWRPHPDWLLDTGLMIEDSNKTDAENSGRLSLIRLFDRHSLRLVVSKANRNPILWETEGKTQFSTQLPPPLNQTFYLAVFRSNPNIAAESIFSREVGLHSLWLDDQMTTDVKLFRYRIDDQIVNVDVTVDPDPETGTKQTYDFPLNLNATKATGIELSFNYSASDARLRWFGGYSWVRADSFSAKQENSFPEHTGFIGGHYNLSDRQQISGVWFHVGEFSWADRRKPVRAYDKLDLRWSYQFESEPALRLELIGKNLLEDYSDYITNQHRPAWVLRLSGEF